MQIHLSEVPARCPEREVHRHTQFVQICELWKEALRAGSPSAGGNGGERQRASRQALPQLQGTLKRYTLRIEKEVKRNFDGERRACLEVSPVMLALSIW